MKRMTGYLLDTNHAAVAMAGDTSFSARLLQYAQPDDQFCLSITVLAELYFAAYASKRREQNLAGISFLLERVNLLDFDLAVAEEYGRIKAKLKAKGRPIPGTDAQIAAVARVHGLTVLTTDRHFRYVDRIDHHQHTLLWPVSRPSHRGLTT